LAKLVVVKLGGSVITDKSMPLSFRSDAAVALAEEIAASDQMTVVVHGGGSFGHPVAKQHGLSSEADSGDAVGVSLTRASMLDLNRLVCKTLTDARVYPYVFSPFDLFAKAGPAALASWIRGLLKSGMTPVTFGDVVPHQGGFRVLSGDSIVAELAKVLKPDGCVFAVDADGVYEPNSRVIIPELTPAKARRLTISRGDDATGGMKLKLEVAAKIAVGRVPVRFVSGYRRNEFSKAIKGLDFYGTLVQA
jgi:isopentenyl phosphate kinase